MGAVGEYHQFLPFFRQIIILPRGGGYPSDGKNMPKSRDSEVLLCSITHSSFALEIENDLTSKSVTPLY